MDGWLSGKAASSDLLTKTNYCLLTKQRHTEVRFLHHPLAGRATFRE